MNPGLDLAALERDPAWARYVGWVRRLGLGFHPDTRGSDYSPPLTRKEAADYDAALDAALGSRTADPYAVAVAVWERDRLI